MKTLAITILLSGMAFAGCDAGLPSNGGWKSIASAPHDGTLVEAADTYGKAPWYGIFRFENKRWVDAENAKNALNEDDGCVFWRPYSKPVEGYTDPTGGHQKSLKYECRQLHAEHKGSGQWDSKNNRCMP